MKGAHDDVAGTLVELDRAGFDAGHRFVHVDGALNAMVLPFLKGGPVGRRPSFRLPIDSLSVSGHKMVGTPMPCGVLVARRVHVARVASAISYLRSDDTTLMGSRNGHAVLAIWNRIMRHGHAGFSRDADECLSRAGRLAAELAEMGANVLHNPFSLTVVFPAPSEAITRKYQLACDKGRAHAVIMPNVDDSLVARFLADYRAWFETATVGETALPAPRSSRLEARA
jgi:histidine decarboxylase